MQNKLAKTDLQTHCATRAFLYRSVRAIEV